MKKIYIIFIFLIAFNSKAQNPIINLDGWNLIGTQNAYYKDIDNYLNDYVGTWLYTNGTTSFKIVLEKKEMLPVGNYYADYIVGEYQYIENGIEKINTLPNLSQIVNSSIGGNNIIKNTNKVRPRCNDCPPDGRRIKITLYDRAKRMNADFTLQRITINGQPALKGLIYGNRDYYSMYHNITPHNVLTVPTGNFVFIKQ